MVTFAILPFRLDSVGSAKNELPLDGPLFLDYNIIPRSLWWKTYTLREIFLRADLEFTIAALSSSQLQTREKQYYIL